METTTETPTLKLSNGLEITMVRPTGRVRVATAKVIKEHEGKDPSSNAQKKIQKFVLDKTAEGESDGVEKTEDAMKAALSEKALTVEEFIALTAPDNVEDVERAIDLTLDLFFVAADKTQWTTEQREQVTKDFMLDENIDEVEKFTNSFRKSIGVAE